MRTVALVIKHEVLTTLGKPSFWITTFVMPVLLLAFSLGTSFLGAQAIDTEPDILTADEDAEVAAIGYVDHAGLIETLPEDVPAARIRAFQDEAQARAAMDAGELSQYYVIAEDYLESGKLLVIDRDYSPLGNIATVGLFNHIVTYNLIDDAGLAELYDDPVANLEVTALAEPEKAERDETTGFVVSYGVLTIFFIVITMSSGFMLRSVSREKENRTVEVLLVSLRPRELMLGKVIGLGLVALLQVAIWGGGSLLTLEQGDALFSMLGVALSSADLLSEGFAVWAALYFLLGYLLYASLLGAIGALAPNARETGPFTFLVLLPLMLPMWLNVIFIEAPHGLIAVVLSLFPLTAPTAMLPRLALGGVPAWQPLAGLAGLAATTYGMVLLSAHFFRADTLLSTAELNWKRLWKEFVRVLKAY